MNTNTPMKAAEAVTHIRLLELRRLINDAHQTANSLADVAKKKANEAITEALLCGQYLTEVKKLVGHGKWLLWLEVNCPEVSQQTVSNYMRLSNYQHVSNLNECASLRQAYIACGILPEPEQSAEPKQLSPVWSTVLERVGKLKAQITECPIAQWPEPEQEQIKTEVKELVALVS